MLGQVIAGFAVALIGLLLTVFGLGTLTSAWTRFKRSAPFYNTESLAYATLPLLMGACCIAGGICGIFEPLFN